MARSQLALPAVCLDVCPRDLLNILGPTFAGESEAVSLAVASCFRYLCLEESCSVTVVKSVVILPALVHVLRSGKGAAVYRAAAGTNLFARAT